jgi:hypothetical protein
VSRYQIPAKALNSILLMKCRPVHGRQVTVSMLNASHDPDAISTLLIYRKVITMRMLVAMA